jgi:DNA (cytosine-5)-methyltransferase 1
MLENVDRLIKSPTSQRGRDFAIMLASLSDLGYTVEWRVINAADYGMPQRRKRTYIMAYKEGSKVQKSIEKLSSIDEWITDSGIMQKAFPMTPEKSTIQEFDIEGSLEDISANMVDYNPKRRPFSDMGIMRNRSVSTYKSKAIYKGKRTTLGDILQDESTVPSEFFLSDTDMERWTYLKGSKKEQRSTKAGFTYTYAEGALTYPDALDRASRTIITGEGGKSASRFKHVVETKSGKFRRLTPIELERLNMFPDNHTEGATDTKRAFFMGNALVVGVVEGLGKELKSRLF